MHLSDYARNQRSDNEADKDVGEHLINPDGRVLSVCHGYDVGEAPAKQRVPRDQMSLMSNRAETTEFSWRNPAP
jgi:hypothetical protein